MPSMIFLSAPRFVCHCRLVLSYCSYPAIYGDPYKLQADLKETRRARAAVWAPNYSRLCVCNRSRLLEMIVRKLSFSRRSRAEAKRGPATPPGSESTDCSEADFKVRAPSPTQAMSPPCMGVGSREPHARPRHHRAARMVARRVSTPSSPSVVSCTKSTATRSPRTGSPRIGASVISRSTTRSAASSYSSRSQTWCAQRPARTHDMACQQRVSSVPSSVRAARQQRASSALAACPAACPAGATIVFLRARLASQERRLPSRIYLLNEVRSRAHRPNPAASPHPSPRTLPPSPPSQRETVRR